MEGLSSHRGEGKEDFSKFLKWARTDCANHSYVGPRHIKDYCCREPNHTHKQCLLVHGFECEYLAEAVLPRHPDLQLEWNLQKDAVADQRPKTRKCKCGKQFIPKSNRQRMCAPCGERNRKRLNRENQRKYRDEKRSRM